LPAIFNQIARINSTVRTFNTLPCAARARASFENSLATPLLCVRRSRSRSHLAAGILSSHSRVTDIPPVLSLLSCLLPVAVALRRANAFLNLSLSPESVESLALVPLSHSFARSHPRGSAEHRRCSGNAECRTVGVYRLTCVYARGCCDRDGASQSGGERRTTRVNRQRK